QAELFGVAVGAKIRATLQGKAAAVLKSEGYHLAMIPRCGQSVRWCGSIFGPHQFLAERREKFRIVLAEELAAKHGQPADSAAVNPSAHGLDVATVERQRRNPEMVNLAFGLEQGVDQVGEVIAAGHDRVERFAGA